MTDRELMQQALYYMDDGCGKYSDDYRKLIDAIRARLAQPEREWQGLTDEEIMDACSAVWASHPIEVGRVVEEKLKEKNNDS